MALRFPTPDGAHVLGTSLRALPELAAFANGVMMRYLDGNDSYPGGGGHASDAISAVLAAAEQCGATGRDVITAVVAAYDVFYNLYTAARMRDKGWDHVFYIAVASAAGSAKVMNLNHSQTLNAIALAITPNLALEVTRRGHLSMWKGCAGGNASRNGLFAALLAADGMTGPDHAIEGVHGLWHVSGKFDIAPFPGGDRPFRIVLANLKYFLSEYHSQAPIAAAIDLHQQLNGRKIESVTIYTYAFAQQEIGNEPEKWHPKTRETADHSLPYIIAAVLLDGRFSDSIFSAERLADAAVHALADKISVAEDGALSAQFPQKVPCRIEAKSVDGVSLVASVEYPRGHFKNPMSDAEVNAKFEDLATRSLTKERSTELLALLWTLEQHVNLDRIFATSVVTPAA
jgi:2-methylcitrate dehydratase